MWIVNLECEVLPAINVVVHLKWSSVLKYAYWRIHECLSEGGRRSNFTTLSFIMAAFIDQSQNFHASSM